MVDKARCKAPAGRDVVARSRDLGGSRSLGWGLVGLRGLGKTAELTLVDLWRLVPSAPSFAMVVATWAEDRAAGGRG